MTTRYAQLVVGPPGSGKSTYCNGMHQFMGAIGRKCSVVNLDPANDSTTYPCALDVRKLVTLEEIMADDSLGPNGGVLYALEELEHNFDWIEEGLNGLGKDYVLFDCPGQVELFTHHDSLRKIFMRIQKMGYRLVVVHLTDSYSLTLPSLYISTLLLSLRTMLQLDMTHINVFTKIDNMRNFPKLPFNLDFYTDVQDLNYLLPSLEDESPMFAHGKFAKLNEAIVELVEEYGLVGFETLAVEDKKSMMHLLQVIDHAIGYAYGTAEGGGDSVWQSAVREGLGHYDIRYVQERWIDNPEGYEEKEKIQWEEQQKRREQEFNKGMPVASDDFDKEMSDYIPANGIKVVRKPPQS